MMNAHSTVEILPDESHLAEAAADRFVGIVEATLRYRQVADVALAGGSTPRAMNALLAASPRRSHVLWDRVRFFFGDERSVPPDDADSNYRMTRETLFEPLGIPAGHVFRMRGEDDPQAAAAAYAGVLVRELGERPRFDLLYLGMGPDGHTASIFPGTVGTIDDSKLVVANWVEQFKTWRITLTPHVINDATHVVITTGGSAKANALAAVLDGPREPDRYPVQLVDPTDGELHWLIDEPAAAKLARRVGAAGRSSSATSR
jgi:6-phosphogluconolactonase